MYIHIVGWTTQDCRNQTTSSMSHMICIYICIHTYTGTYLKYVYTYCRVDYSRVPKPDNFFCASYDMYIYICIYICIHTYTGIYSKYVYTYCRVDYSRVPKPDIFFYASYDKSFARAAIGIHLYTHMCIYTYIFI